MQLFPCWGLKICLCHKRADFGKSLLAGLASGGIAGIPLQEKKRGICPRTSNSDL
jgi:hypothetical protein